MGESIEKVKNDLITVVPAVGSGKQQLWYGLRRHRLQTGESIHLTIQSTSLCRRVQQRRNCSLRPSPL